MLSLSDTLVRMYRKKDGRASLRLRSYLLVTTNVGFRLSAYLKNISCRLRLVSGETIEFEEIAYSENLVCQFQLETMVHDFWASGIANMPTIKDQVGVLRVDYHLSFTNHPYERPSFFEVVVPVIARTTRYALSPVS